MSRFSTLIAFAAIAATPTLARAQAVDSALGAVNRANAAVGTVNSANAAAAASTSDSPTAAPAPYEGATSPGIAPTPTTGEAADAEPTPEEVRGLTYDPEGRRDPFRPLTGEAADSEIRRKFEGTPKGRLLSEVKLTSILRHPDGNIAVFEGGPKKEGYFMHVGDEFWDAQIVRIDFDTMTVVVRQKVEDPRLIKQWRDFPIPLWTEEERKGGTSSTSAP